MDPPQRRQEAHRQEPEDAEGHRLRQAATVRLQNAVVLRARVEGAARAPALTTHHDLGDAWLTPRHLDLVHPSFRQQHEQEVAVLDPGEVHAAPRAPGALHLLRLDLLQITLGTHHRLEDRKLPAFLAALAQARGDHHPSSAGRSSCRHVDLQPELPRPDLESLLDPASLAIAPPQHDRLAGPLDGIQLLVPGALRGQSQRLAVPRAQQLQRLSLAVLVTGEHQRTDQPTLR